MDPLARAESVWYRVAGLASRDQRDTGVGIIEAEIRSGQYEVSLEAARLVLTDATPIEIARQLRERAERTIRPTKLSPPESTPTRGTFRANRARQPGAERPESAIVQGHRAPGEAERGDKEPSTLTEHAAKLPGRRSVVNWGDR